jgi:DNA-binding MarR family transcriptional regulator
VKALTPPTEAADPLETTVRALRRVGLAMKGRMQGQLAEHGLTFPQFLAMKALQRHGRLTVKALADALEVTPANVTGIVTRLEREGFVTRARDASDRRIVYVRLTEQGHEKMTHLFKAGSALVADMFEEWTPADHARLADLLSRVRLRPGEAGEF